MIYFKKNEFHMGNENVYDKMNTMFLVALDELRKEVGEPMIITSSYRSPEYNAKINGAKHSMHLLGRAVDIYCDNGTFRAKIVKAALDMGLTCGTAKSFVHIDNRVNQILFTYD